MNLFAQSSTIELTDIILVPSILFVLGLGIWYGGLLFENRTEKSWLKWLAFVPILIGLYMGIQMTIEVGDYTYQRLLGSKKLIYGHYLGLALPVIASITVVGWHFYLKKSGAYDQRY